MLHELASPRCQPRSELNFDVGTSFQSLRLTCPMSIFTDATAQNPLQESGVKTSDAEPPEKLLGNSSL